MSDYEGIHSSYWGKAIDPVQLQAWFMANMPDEKLIYKDGMAQQVMFVRDTVTGVLARSYFEYKRLPKVISTHTSKSVRLPVYYFDSAYARLILRNNFYDWKISVDSKVGPLEMDLDGLCMTDEPINACYCEGFQTEWVFPAYAQSKEKFTLELGSNHQLYTFLFLLKQTALKRGIFAKQEVQTKLGHLATLLTKLDEFSERKRAGTVPNAQRMHGYSIFHAFESLRDEARSAPGVARFPALREAFQKFYAGSRFNVQEDRAPARKLLVEVQGVLNAI